MKASFEFQARLLCFVHRWRKLSAKSKRMSDDVVSKELMLRFALPKTAGVIEREISKRK